MPTNSGHEAISALKAGHESVSAAYAGHQQIFPNTTTIQSAAYNPSGHHMTCAGGNRPFRVIGDIGATYDLTGSLTGSYTQTSSTVDYSVSANNVCSVCDSPALNYVVTLTPTGSTVLQGGGSTFSDTFTRDAGPVTNNYTATASISATNTNRVTTTVGGNLYWAAGSSWDVSWSWGNPTGYSSHASLNYFGSGSFSGTTPTYGSPGSGTATWTMTSSQLSVVIFRIYIYSTGCNGASNSPVTTGYIYP